MNHALPSIDASRQQIACRRAHSLKVEARAGTEKSCLKSGLGVVLAGWALLLAGCGEAPLSALDAASEPARHIANIWYAMAWGSAVILLLMLVFVAVAVKARNGSGAHSAARSRWLLFGGGVLFPVSVMAALLVYAYGAAPSQGKAMYQVQVTAHQWWWEVSYPDAPGGPRYSVNELHIPAGAPVNIQLNAIDVIHSFWVPRLGGKMDAIPGRQNRLVYTAPEPGIYQGTCAEYCGAGHAQMRFRVIAHEQPALEAALSSLPTSKQERP